MHIIARLKGYWSSNVDLRTEGLKTAKITVNRRYLRTQLVIFSQF